MLIFIVKKSSGQPTFEIRGTRTYAGLQFVNFEHFKAESFVRVPLHFPPPTLSMNGGYWESFLQNRLLIIFARLCLSGRGTAETLVSLTLLLISGIFQVNLVVSFLHSWYFPVPDPKVEIFLSSFSWRHHIISSSLTLKFIFSSRSHLIDFLFLLKLMMSLKRGNAVKIMKEIQIWLLWYKPVLGNKGICWKKALLTGTKVC
jgi:hypothetical protein